MIYDAVIAGGGTAGLYFALQLGKRGFKTLVLEKNHQIVFPEGLISSISLLFTSASG